MTRIAQRGADALRGVIVAAVTPRRQNETSIDLGATLDLLDFLGQSGANGIALLGSTGEFVHFDLDDRRQMTALAAKRSRLPLLVNVSHSTLDGAVELACAAADSRVAGVLLMPPYYFRYSQEAIREFYLDFAEQTRGDPPIYLYNIPAFTNEVEISTALDLLGTGLFAGIKDSGGSWDYFIQLRDHAARQPTYAILIGDDRLFARARQCGADGAVSGLASAVPELLVAIEAAVQTGDHDRARALDARIAEFMEWILKFPLPMAIKEAVRLRRLRPGGSAIELGEKQRNLMSDFASWFGPWLNTVLQECMVKTGRHSAR